MTRQFYPKIVLIWACFMTLSTAAPVWAQEKPSVGVQATIDVIIKGTEVVARPLPECKIPVVARIAKKKVTQGALQYTIAYYALEPGEFDLRDALQRKSGEALSDVSPILVNVQSVLPPGQVEPNTIESSSLPFTSTYESTLVLAAILWVLGLFAILLSGRSSKAEAVQVEEKVLTLGERMQPLISKAIEGDLDSDGQAELERILLSHWRAKLQLTNMTAGEAMAKMRQDSEAGPLLRKLEEWLHRPGAKDGVKVREILSDYVDQPFERGQPS